ncbi:MAG TPA: hypothetical protein VFW62_12120, partial [bacterium]|nr:hypothetical protein [bacterium]
HFAATRSYLDFDHYHVAGTTDALGFDRLAGFEDDALGGGLPNEDEDEEEDERVWREARREGAASPLVIPSRAGGEGPRKRRAMWQGKTVAETSSRGPSPSSGGSG